MLERLPARASAPKRAPGSWARAWLKPGPCLEQEGSGPARPGCLRSPNKQLHKRSAETLGVEESPPTTLPAPPSSPLRGWQPACEHPALEEAASACA